MAAPFVLGLGTIVGSFIALKNYKKEQLKSEIIDFAKNSKHRYRDAYGSTRTADYTSEDSVKSSIANLDGDVKVIGWRIWSKQEDGEVDFGINDTFDPRADTHLTAFVFLEDGEFRFYSMSEIIWPEKIRRPIVSGTELWKSYGFFSVE